MDTRWCATYARQLAAGNRDDIRRVEGDITGMDTHVGLAPTSPGRIRITIIDIDPDTALRADLSVPVLVVEVGTPNGPSPVVIDGWDQIYRARCEGRQTLPTIALGPETELQCRVHCPQREHRAWRGLLRFH
ncbi:hypothetical protein [Saccharopolyspora rosea]|nr:hypothetical protein [Saccharopolyspora rosea]